MLFYGPLLDRYPAGFQKSSTHTLGKDLEEKYGIPDTLEVVWYLQPFEELAQLDPGGGVFLEDGN